MWKFFWKNEIYNESTMNTASEWSKKQVKRQFWYVILVPQIFVPWTKVINNSVWLRKWLFCVCRNFKMLSRLRSCWTSTKTSWVELRWRLKREKPRSRIWNSKSTKRATTSTTSPSNKKSLASMFICMQSYLSRNIKLMPYDFLWIFFVKFRLLKIYISSKKENRRFKCIVCISSFFESRNLNKLYVKSLLMMNQFSL